MDFPTLILQRSDEFIICYKQEPKKLVFTFVGLDAHSLGLVCYLLNKDREKINTTPIVLTRGVDNSIDLPFFLGSLELNKDDLRALIGKPNKINTFSYLEFVASKDSGNAFICYDVTSYVVDANNIGTVLGKAPANPCPPRKQG